MTVEHVLGIIGVLLIAYLFMSIIKPERF